MYELELKIDRTSEWRAWAPGFEEERIATLRDARRIGNSRCEGLGDWRIVFVPPTDTARRIVCGLYPMFGDATVPPSVSPGIYRHYKGDVYVVTSVGTLDEHGHGNADAPKIVTYHSTRSFKDGLLNHRWEHEFSEFVPWPDGTTKPRFTRIE